MLLFVVVDICRYLASVSFSFEVPLATLTEIEVIPH